MGQSDSKSGAIFHAKRYSLHCTALLAWFGAFIVITSALSSVAIDSNTSVEVLNSTSNASESVESGEFLASAIDEATAGVSLPTDVSKLFEGTNLPNDFIALIQSGRLFKHSMGLLEYLPLWRLRVKIHTCDEADATTQEIPFIQLSSNDEERFHLLYAPDQNTYAQNLWYTFDVVHPNVQYVADIQRIHVAVGGSDPWCIDSFSMYINNATDSQPIFKITEKLWLGGMGYDSDTIRSHTQWYMDQDRLETFCALPDQLSQAFLESYIEAMASNALIGERMRWGDLDGRRYTEITRNDDKSVKVSLDLETTTKYSPEANVEFILVISCDDNGYIKMIGDQYKVDLKYKPGNYLNIFHVESPAWAAGYIHDRVESAFKAATKDAASIRVYKCPQSINVPNDEEGIRFVWNQTTIDLFRTLGQLGLALNE